MGRYLQATRTYIALLQPCPLRPTAFVCARACDRYSIQYWHVLCGYIAVILSLGLEPLVTSSFFASTGKH